MIRFTAAESAALLRTHDWLRGFGEPAPTGVASLNEPDAGALHFVEAKHIAAAAKLVRASCLVLPPGVDGPTGLRMVVHALPKIAVQALLVDLRELRGKGQRFASRDGAQVATGADVDASVRLEPGVVVFAGASVGADTELHAGAVIRSGAVVGRRCRIHAGAVIGADGFGYAFDGEGVGHQIPHLGGVEIGDDVDIGPNSVVAAGTIDPTRIRPQTKVDGHVYVGHNAQVGARVLIAAGAIVGGSAHVGDQVWLHPGAILRTKTVVGARAVIGAGAVVMKAVGEGQTVIGEVAGDAATRLRRDASLDRLLRGSREA